MERACAHNVLTCWKAGVLHCIIIQYKILHSVFVYDTSNIVVASHVCSAQTNVVNT